jgi:hypothetical protein
MLNPTSMSTLGVAFHLVPFLMPPFLAHCHCRLYSLHFSNSASDISSSATAGHFSMSGESSGMLSPLWIPIGWGLMTFGALRLYELGLAPLIAVAILRCGIDLTCLARASSLLLRTQFLGGILAFLVARYANFAPHSSQNVLSRGILAPHSRQNFVSSPFCEMDLGGSGSMAFTGGGCLGWRLRNAIA